MANLTNIYSDLDLTFNRTPVKGDVALSYDAQAVIRSVRNLLSTNFYERPFQPQLGSNLGALLFEPASAMTANLLKDEITNTITNYEPRVKINSIDVSLLPDGNSFSATISFYIGNNTTPTAFNLLLQRSR